MFSSLGPLFKTMFRQAEHADTRLEIRRDEKRESKKNTEFEDRPDDNDMWEDSTDVSVSALRLFLQNFVSGKTARSPSGSEAASNNAFSASEDPSLTPPIAPDSPAVNSMTARAVSAYQHQTGYRPAPAAAASTPPQSDVDLVSGEDVRVIYALLSDLDDLASRGVETLRIRKAASFLESLTNAVQEYRNAL